MARIDVQTVANNPMVLVDLSNLSGTDIIQTLDQAKKVISKLGEKKALILTDVTNAKYDKEVAGAIKEFAKFNTPYVKASAVVGIQGVQSVLLQTAIFISRRDIKSFNTRSEAINWFTAI